MPYVTSIERMAKEEGHREGRQEILREAILDALEVRFGTIPESIRERVNATTDESRLRDWHHRAVVCATLPDFQQAIA